MAIITQISNATNLSGASGTKINSAATPAGTAGSAKASDNATKLKNQFLSILLTQMEHQNPLDPMDTKEFTGQLTQFSALEQQIDTNTKLDNLFGAINQNNISSAFGYIGQTVDLKTSNTPIQNNSANWKYALPEDAKSVAISVTDAAGKIVYSGTMTNAAGGSGINKGTYSLNLTQSDFNRAMADGEVLKVNITAKNGADKAIIADINTSVSVDSLQSDKKGTYLQAGGMIFGMGDVLRITKPATPTPPATTV